MTRMSLLLCAALAATAAAETPAKPKASAKGKTKAPEITIPSFGAIPKGEDMKAVKSTDLGMETKASAAAASYTVLKVQHGRSFLRSPTGATPAGGGLQEITLSGVPPSTEKFTTVVRVKCAQKANTSIDLVLLDPRGDTVMSSSGELNYRGTKSDELDYSIDWTPTPWPSGGEFKMLVRIGGQAMGTWPVKVVGPKT
jgi:hypothetical protein